jgi:cell division protein FtsB
MKVDLGIWGKLTWVVIVLALLSGLMLVGGWYLPLISQNERMRAEILKLDTQLQQEEDLAKRLKSSYEALRHDSNTVERLVREKFGYAKAGETVFRFEPPATNNQSSH